MAKNVRVRARLAGVFGWFVVGSVFFFTPSVTQGTLYDLALNIDGSRGLDAYDYYAWSRGVSWEVTESVLATRVFFNEVFTFDSTPNLISMHLLDIEANNSYRYNLGYVVTASFGVDESLQSNVGSIGQGNPGLVSANSPTDADTFGSPPDIPGNKTITPVPEPVVLGFFAFAALYGKWRKKSA